MVVSTLDWTREREADLLGVSLSRYLVLPSQRLRQMLADGSDAHVYCYDRHARPFFLGQQAWTMYPSFWLGSRNVLEKDFLDQSRLQASFYQHRKA